MSEDEKTVKNLSLDELDTVNGGLRGVGVELRSSQDEELVSERINLNGRPWEKSDPISVPLSVQDLIEQKTFSGDFLEKG